MQYAFLLTPRQLYKLMRRGNDLLYNLTLPLCFITQQVLEGVLIRVLTFFLYKAHESFSPY